ncbi:hypothetical protein Tco_1239725 [Tanacetum coccineum]
MTLFTTRLTQFLIAYNIDSQQKWLATDKKRVGIMVDLIYNYLVRHPRKSERLLVKELDLGLQADSETDDLTTMSSFITREIPSDRIEVLRYDTKGVKVRNGIMHTKIEITLEQTQQGVSDEVLVSIEGVEE